MYKDAFSIVNRVHSILQVYLAPGDRAIDATAGQGYDTLFLAQQVGSLGKVWAFDIQPSACAITRERMSDHGIDWVQVICGDHCHLADYVQEPVKAGVFNLGYLPGSNHAVVTRGESTLAALNAIMQLLLPEGIVVMVCYLGHDGGREEYEMIQSALSMLPAKDWRVEEFRFINKPSAPRVITVIKGK